jgi:hypothetical protein
MDELRVLNSWRHIFASDGVNEASLAKAEVLLEDLPGESPLLLRLAGELEELKKRHAATSKKHRSPRTG